MVLIESLNEDGYLEDSLGRHHRQPAPDPGEDGRAESREELLDHLRIALRWLQSMDRPALALRPGSAWCLQLRQRIRQPRARTGCHHRAQPPGADGAARRGDCCWKPVPTRPAAPRTALITTGA